MKSIGFELINELKETNSICLIVYLKYKGNKLAKDISHNLVLKAMNRKFTTFETLKE
jgi:hypothetical protein